MSEKVRGLRSGSDDRQNDFFSSGKLGKAQDKRGVGLTKQADAPHLLSRNI